MKIVAVSRKAGPVEVGELDVTIRRRKEILVPADASELVFRTGKSSGKDIAARLKLTANSGTIVVRPLSSAGSASGLAWMLGRRGGVTAERLAVGFQPK